MGALASGPGPMGFPVGTRAVDDRCLPVGRECAAAPRPFQLERDMRRRRCPRRPRLAQGPALRRGLPDHPRARSASPPGPPRLADAQPLGPGLDERDGARATSSATARTSRRGSARPASTWSLGGREHRHRATRHPRSVVRAWMGSTGHCAEHPEPGLPLRRHRGQRTAPSRATARSAAARGPRTSGCGMGRVTRPSGNWGQAR